MDTRELNPATLYAGLLGRLSGEAPQLRGLTGADASEIEASWRTWLPALFARYLSDPSTGELVPFGEHHADFWDWVWSLRLGKTSRPMICIWPRGGGKSTSAELAGAMVGALRTRRYVLYVCESLDRAEDHVQNVAGMFESAAIERYYPHVADRMVSKFGNVKGWRRNRLRTASGFTVDAIGLDVAARGIKLDDVRPDMLILDDLDGELDSPGTTARKIKTLTSKFLPAGSPDLAILGVQNLIHPDSIFSQLAGLGEEPADFLRDRIVSGPFPAVHDLTYEDRDGRYVITGGKPIWAGMDLPRCQDFVNRYGLRAFLSESQQEVDAPEGGMFDHLTFKHCTPEAVPDLVRVVTWVDPAVTDTDASDAHGIQIDGIDASGIIYRLFSWEHRASPERALTMAIVKALEHGSDSVGVETDQGGDTWAALYASLIERIRGPGVKLDGILYRLPANEAAPKFLSQKAGAGLGPKAHRASQMLTAYEQGKIIHVTGTHALVEKALRRFPLKKPFDLVDASFYSWLDLTQTKPARTRSRWIG